MADIARDSDFLPGTVWLVGAGPGDPELLTRKAERLIVAASVVFYDALVGKGVIERDIETKIPDKNARLVLYCGGGYRSALVAENLQRMGYTQPVSLDGGWRAIKDSGLPLEK